MGCSSLPLPPPAVHPSSPEALLCQVENTLQQSRDQSFHTVVNVPVAPLPDPSQPVLPKHQQTNASTPGFLILLWWLTLSFGPLANAPEQRWGVGADTESWTHGDRHNSAVQCLCITTNPAPKLHNVTIHRWVEHHLYCSGGVFP